MKMQKRPYIRLPSGVNSNKQMSGAGVAQWLCNGLPHDGPGFYSWWEQCKYRALRPPQGTVNGGAVSK